MPSSSYTGLFFVNCEVVLKIKFKKIDGQHQPLILVTPTVPVTRNNRKEQIRDINYEKFGNINGNAEMFLTLKILQCLSWKILG